jgi:hypothetical protein
LTVDEEDDPDGDIYLVRVAKSEGEALVWIDEMRKIREPERERISFNISKEMLDRLKEYPQNNKPIFEVDLFTTPTPVLNSEKRPFVPKMLMVAERNSGMSWVVSSSSRLNRQQSSSKLSPQVYLKYGTSTE